MGNFATGDVEAALRGRDDPERFVEAFGEKSVARLGLGVVGTVDPPDFAAAGGDEQARRGDGDDTADLEHDGVGHGERGALPIAILGGGERFGRLDEAFGGGGVVGLRECEERNGEAGENRERERKREGALHGENYQTSEYVRVRSTLPPEMGMVSCWRPWRVRTVGFKTLSFGRSR